MSVQLIRGSKWLPERAGARCIAWLVWIVWAVLLLIALVTVLRYARNIPIAEDWFMSEMVCEHRTDRGELSSQRRESRNPSRCALCTLAFSPPAYDPVR